MVGPEPNTFVFRAKVSVDCVLLGVLIEPKEPKVGEPYKVRPASCNSSVKYPSFIGGCCRHFEKNQSIHNREISHYLLTPGFALWAILVTPMLVVLFCNTHESSLRYKVEVDLDGCKTVLENASIYTELFAPANTSDPISALEMDYCKVCGVARTDASRPCRTETSLLTTQFLVLIFSVLTPLLFILVTARDREIPGPRQPSSPLSARFIFGSNCCRRY